MWTYLWIHKEVQRWLIKLITPLIVRDRLEQLWFLLWVKPVNGERYCVHWKCFQVKNSSPVTSSAISLCKMYKKKIDWQMETCTQAAELIFPKANSLNGKRGGCCNIGGRRFLSAAKWAHQTKKTCTTASLLHTVPCHAPCATESKLSLKAETQCACVYTHPQKHFGCHRCFFGVYSGYSLKRICLIGSSVIAPVEFILNYSFLVILECHIKSWQSDQTISSHFMYSQPELLSFYLNFEMPFTLKLLIANSYLVIAYDFSPFEPLKHNIGNKPFWHRFIKKTNLMPWTYQKQEKTAVHLFLLRLVILKI